jgi:hypothetical protein
MEKYMLCTVYTGDCSLHNQYFLIWKKSGEIQLQNMFNQTDILQK